jgi:hypothetical protein
MVGSGPTLNKTYNKDTIKNILLEDCELSVDFGSQIGEDAPYRNHNGEAAVEMCYPAILTMRMFIDGIEPIPPKDTQPSLPTPETSDNTIERS